MKTAACVIVKNEEHDFLEWCCFHLAAGFDAILVYDNFSTDRTAAMAAMAGRVGDVRVRPWESTPRQVGAYAAALQGFRREFDWIAFVDSDEFLFAPGHRDIKDFLAGFPDAPAIGAHWLCFGSSGIRELEDRLVIEQFVHRAPDGYSSNRHIKSIVRPLEVVRPLNGHRFELVGDQLYRDGNSALIDDWIKWGKTARIKALDRVRINHYYTRSRAHYDRKLARSDVNVPVLRDDFDRMDHNKVFDDSALAYRDAVHALIAAAGGEAPVFVGSASAHRHHRMPG